VTRRDDLIELYRGYQSTFFLDRCFDLRVHRSGDSTATLEYASEGKVTATGRPYGNRYVSVVTIKDRKIIHWRDYLDPLRVFAALDDTDLHDRVRRPGHGRPARHTRQRAAQGPLGYTGPGHDPQRGG
jgi:hypothetical protein